MFIQPIKVSKFHWTLIIGLLKQDDSSKRKKTEKGRLLPVPLLKNVVAKGQLVLSQHKEMLLVRGFILKPIKPTERP